MAAGSKPKTRKRGTTKRPRKRRTLRYFIAGLLIGLASFLFYLDFEVRTQFEGKRWDLPAHVYARPLELYQGAPVSADALAAELGRLGYRRVRDPGGAGTYSRRGDSFDIMSRPFVFWDGPQGALSFSVDIAGTRVQAVYRSADRKPLAMARLEPLLIGSISPRHHEDRSLVKLADVPPALMGALVAVEDHNFFEHHGVDPRGLVRALVANLRAGRTVQGGSTLTQQLVKNFYLTADRTLQRKAMEMVMAVLLELHYTKAEILEAYLNEIYLGQEGNRAIHGFGLASQFYFGRPLGELKLAEQALLVGIIKGPSYYNPRSHPQRALARRNLVLDEMLRRGLIDEQTARGAKAAALGVTARPAGSLGANAAYLDLVRRQLQRDYRDEDLQTEGLQVFTTLDPAVQAAAERAMSERLARVEQWRKLPAGTLEGAAVVVSPDSGEVLALVGGRERSYAGFNRALDARRPIGSLVKPAVYLTALAQPRRYTLITPLDDSPLTWREAGAKAWTPRNYDKQFHGQVPLHRALARSLNVATARLGLELGVRKVIATLHELGIERDLPPYASTLLGAVELSPLEVAQMYGTLASGGFRLPQRAIREVVSAAGKPLSRYGLEIRQAVDPAPTYLVTTALQEVVREGTARGLARLLPASLEAAGKTGTTDDYRDSWFAGFTGNLLAVVWVGRDDNQPVGLSGAGGAMLVWGDIMRSLEPAPLVLAPPADVEQVWIDPGSGLRADADCPGAIELPFIQGSAPLESAPCAGESGTPATGGGLRRWLERIFR
jgi:penicillin-binding protein 1B